MLRRYANSWNGIMNVSRKGKILKGDSALRTFWNGNYRMRSGRRKAVDMRRTKLKIILATIVLLYVLGEDTFEK